ncbi:hypothetical protein BCR34DRAFT_590024 [Clohesyomyces aquaticus]|uniref:Uncharacterized protein n=1 Tax=Clohesyomyces aquaticus TaxID=1231657 RepID=A0A1Y1ZDT5_9PLEO|nr:hypothetical protein BCR34DRAFT_590024 [Clohesyomyces aquaticus]
MADLDAFQYFGELTFNQGLEEIEKFNWGPPFIYRYEGHSDNVPGDVGHDATASASPVAHDEVNANVNKNTGAGNTSGNETHTEPGYTRTVEHGYTNNVPSDARRDGAAETSMVAHKLEVNANLGEVTGAVNTDGKEMQTEPVQTHTVENRSISTPIASDASSLVETHASQPAVEVEPSELPSSPRYVAPLESHNVYSQHGPTFEPHISDDWNRARNQWRRATLNEWDDTSDQHPTLSGPRRLDSSEETFRFEDHVQLPSSSPPRRDANTHGVNQTTRMDIDDTSPTISYDQVQELLNFVTPANVPPSTHHHEPSINEAASTIEAPVFSGYDETHLPTLDVAVKDFAYDFAPAAELKSVPVDTRAASEPPSQTFPRPKSVPAYSSAIAAHPSTPSVDTNLANLDHLDRIVNTAAQSELVTIGSTVTTRIKPEDVTYDMAPDTAQNKESPSLVYGEDLLSQLRATARPLGDPVAGGQETLQDTKSVLFPRSPGFGERYNGPTAVPELPRAMKGLLVSQLAADDAGIGEKNNEPSEDPFAGGYEIPRAMTGVQASYVAADDTGIAEENKKPTPVPGSPPKRTQISVTELFHPEDVEVPVSPSKAKTPNIIAPENVEARPPTNNATSSTLDLNSPTIPSNATAPATIQSAPQPSPEDIRTMPVHEMRTLLSQLRIPRPSSSRKEDLIRILTGHFHPGTYVPPASQSVDTSSLDKSHYSFKAGTLSLHKSLKIRGVESGKGDSRVELIRKLQEHEGLLVKGQDAEPNPAEGHEDQEDEHQSKLVALYYETTPKTRQAAAAPKSHSQMHRKRSLAPKNPSSNRRNDMDFKPAGESEEEGEEGGGVVGGGKRRKKSKGGRK